MGLRAPRLGVSGKGGQPGCSEGSGLREVLALANEGLTCACPPSPGAPTRDVLLVSAIITVSLSVTILLCGLCHWCQRKLVRLLHPAPTEGS